jgi:hypothetical protein
LTLRDFQAEWQHLQAVANRRSSSFVRRAATLRSNLKLRVQVKPRLYDW